MADEDTNAGAIPDDQDTAQSQPQQNSGGDDLISQALAAVNDTVNYTRAKYGLTGSDSGGSPDVIDLSGGDKGGAETQTASTPSEATPAPAEQAKPQDKAIPDEDTVDDRFTSQDVTHSPDVEDRRTDDTSMQPASDSPVRAAVGAIPVVGQYINQAADTLASGASNRADQLRARWQGYTNPMSKELGYDDIGGQ